MQNNSVHIIVNKSFHRSLLTGKLHDIIEYVHENNNLFSIQIRHDYLNIYYKGGNILKISGEGAFEFNGKYFCLKKDENKSKEEWSLYKQKGKDIVKELLIDNWNPRRFFDVVTNVMDKWFELHPKPERTVQHQIIINNSSPESSDFCVIDIEYAISRNSYYHYVKKDKTDKKQNPCFDIIAVNRDGKVCVIELKKGTGALLGTSGIADHIYCYNHSIGQNAYNHLFVKDIIALQDMKKEIGCREANCTITKTNSEFLFAYEYSTTDHEEEKRRFLDIAKREGASGYKCIFINNEEHMLAYRDVEII